MANGYNMPERSYRVGVIIMAASVGIELLAIGAEKDDSTAMFKQALEQLRRFARPDYSPIPDDISELLSTGKTVIAAFNALPPPSQQHILTDDYAKLFMEKASGLEAELAAELQQQQ
ncbi:hypothetical protein HYX10_03060 [Candidatus Woesearchaeota archaeon]|nr:hypothetical protein [Candidatus Woesearchaeota archaeon]